MSAAELLFLSQKLTNHAIGYGDYAIAGQLREAAEVLELLAWAEENKAEVEFGGRFWWVKVDGFLSSGPTYIGTLRRAREAAR